MDKENGQELDSAARFQIRKRLGMSGGNASGATSGPSKKAKKSSLKEFRQNLRKMAKSPTPSLPDEVQTNYSDSDISVVRDFYRDNCDVLSTIDLNTLHDGIYEESSNIDSVDNYEIPVPVKEKKQSNKEKKKTTAVAAKRWTWDDDKTVVLIENILSYKNSKIYEGLDFESNLIELYTELRKTMAEMHPADDFGPYKIMYQDIEDMEPQQLTKYRKSIDKMEKQTKEGYNRIKNKVRTLRREFKKAVDAGTRSGSGKMIKENFDTLKEIWHGCPAVDAIENAISSYNNEDDTTDNHEGEDANNDSGDDNDSGDEPINQTNASDNIQKDNSDKRAKLTKKISAHQRDMLFVDIAKKELKLKTEQVEIMKRSVEQTDESIRVMMESMKSVGKDIKDGLAMLANAFIASNQPTHYAPPYNPYGVLTTPGTQQFQSPFQSPPGGQSSAFHPPQS